MGEENSGAEGPKDPTTPGASAAPATPPPTPPPVPSIEEVQSTTGGAAMIMYSPWLTAAAVAAFATRAMWVKFRKIGLAAQKSKQKKRQDKASEEPADDHNDSESEADSDCESDDECESELVGDGAPADKQDKMLSDAGPIGRPIKS